MAEMITGLACPSCNGTLSVREGQRIVKCPYCSHCSYVKGERGLPRFQVARRVERPAAEGAVRQFWEGMNKAADLKQKANIQELFLAYVPYWRGQASVVGWFFGREQEGSGEHRRMVPRERKIRSDMEWTGAAGDVGEFGVESVSTDGKSLAAYDADALHHEGLVFEPVGSADEALATARLDWETRARQGARLSEISQAWLQRLRERLSMVFYPLWVARYTYRNRVYPVVVDGFSGKVLYGKAPGNVLFRAMMLVGGTGLGSCVIVNGLYLAAQILNDSSSHSRDSGWLLVIPFVVGAGLIGAGYRAFRFGEEIEQREKRQ